MMNVLRNKSAIFILFFLLCVLSSFSSQAATLTWTGGGADNLTANPSNWSGGIIPQDGDWVVFDNTSTKDCTWDLPIALASLTLEPGYNGAVKLSSFLRITGDLIISGGVLDQNDQTLLIGFSPPTASTDSGISTNGNSAALTATVNPNGLDTTVYFECGTGTSYNVSTAPQSIGNGTTAVTVSDDITGLLQNVAYQCRVVVTNAYGTVYGDDVSFTTPPITIIYPLNGDTISRPDVMVRGNILNTTGSEIGVTVNGMVATLYNNEFVINHVRLNTITATATDTAGNTSTASITVNAATTLPHVTLRANIESGIAPLATYFSVSTSIPNSVLSYSFDYDGDAIADYTGTTFDDIGVTYQSEGIYYPTLSITDSQSNVYTATIAIVVLNQNDLDTLLRAKWNAMKTALANQDVEGAVEYFIEGSKDKYRTVFEALRPQLPMITGTFIEFNIINVHENIAEYELVTYESGVLYSYPGFFIKDGNGIWKFNDF